MEEKKGNGVGIVGGSESLQAGHKAWLRAEGRSGRVRGGPVQGGIEPDHLNDMEEKPTVGRRPGGQRWM